MKQPFEVFHARGYIAGIEYEKSSVGEEVTHEWQRVRSTHCFDTRNGAQACEQIIELIRLEDFLGVLISKRGKNKIHGDHVFGAKTRLHGKYADQAASKKSGADQQHQGNRELTRDNRLAESLCALTADLFAAALGESIADIPRGRAHCGEGAEGRSHDARQAHSKQQHRHVERDGVEARQIPGSQRQKKIHAPASRERSNDCAYGAKQRRLD